MVFSVISVNTKKRTMIFKGMTGHCKVRINGHMAQNIRTLELAGSDFSNQAKLITTFNF